MINIFDVICFVFPFYKYDFCAPVQIFRHENLQDFAEISEKLFSDVQNLYLLSAHLEAVKPEFTGFSGFFLVSFMQNLF